jgi:ion channel-forming bestrophin family protein
MSSWHFTAPFAFPHVGKRLAFLLIIVAVYCLVADFISWEWNVRLFAWGSAASVLNTIILGLLLSFRNQAAYSRWWEARTSWGQLTNDSRNLAGKLAAYLPADALSQARVSELLAGFAEALKRHLRDEKPRLRDLKGFENETDDPAHVPLYLSRRLYSLVADWKRAGHIDQAVVWILDPHLRGLIDVCGACERIRNTPLAPSYKNMLRTGLALNVIVEPWLTMPDVGYWNVPAFLLVCFFLLGIELIDSVVEEPFGREPDDLDLDRYCQTIREGVQMHLPTAVV